ncbi:hypothetical protein [Cryobacterium sp. Y57]|uniref:hypothetical protein n=1 Tax=Cryobacterium sp. Y57 TaxID=2048287 RepID=UPI000CE302A7|nr:hypothetical protein [Cryobacterium sp. Y57]
MTVGDYLPRGHRSYARVMNPLHDDAGQPMAWRALAKEQSEVDASTKWTDLSDTAREVERTIGTIDPHVAATLARLLRAHTSAPTECFFLVWEGYAGMRDDLRDTASITILPDREVLILAGDLADGAEPFDGMDGGRSAQWWMPADGVWAVGNDLYGASVYVSGTEELITAILAADSIEAYRATASMQIVAEEWAS